MGERKTETNWYCFRLYIQISFLGFYNPWEDWAEQLLHFLPCPLDYQQLLSAFHTLWRTSPQVVEILFRVERLQENETGTNPEQTYIMDNPYEAQVPFTYWDKVSVTSSASWHFSRACLILGGGIVRWNYNSALMYRTFFFSLLV